jgi:hypothetical protein
MLFELVTSVLLVAGPQTPSQRPPDTGQTDQLAADAERARNRSGARD